MTYFTVNRDDQSDLGIVPGDSAADAFGRLRVSQGTILFNSKQDLTAQDQLFVTSASSGGTFTYSSNRASTSLNVTTASGSSAIRRSRPYIPYQPGKGTLYLSSVVIGGGQTNTVKRVGMFDSKNGIFFIQNGTTFGVGVRSFVTGTAIDTVVTQANWNLDKFDGTGISLISLDLTKVQILVIDFQWLGAGRIRFGFDINGDIKYCHEIKNANVISSVYMTTPNLPASFEITNTATAASAASLEQICTAVFSEGGIELIGQPFSCSTGVLGRSIDTTFTPLITLRAKAANSRVPIKLTDFSLISGGSKDLYWALMLNPVVTGGTAASYTSVNADSLLEFDVARTGAISGGTVLMSGYSTATLKYLERHLNDLNSYLFATNFDGTVRDELVLAVQQFANPSGATNAAINWEEFV